MLRVILIPIFIWMILQPNFCLRAGGLFLFLAASITDFLDGELARRWKVTSEFGKFLDPLADKFLVISTLIALLYLEDQIEIWMVLVIIGRDMLITAMRWLAIRRGSSLHTSRMGKIKTTFQLFSIIIILLILVVRTHPESAAIRQSFAEARLSGHSAMITSIQAFQSAEPHVWLVGLPYFAMLATTIFTAISGLRYIISNFHLFQFRSGANNSKKD